MCGIVGVVCKSHFGFSQKQVDVFHQMLFVDELRGEDSTGIIYVENDNGFGILKDNAPASWIASSMLHNSLLQDKIRKGKALIGHNRKATVGRVVAETAHPFVVDDKFAMVHNGTLRGHKLLKDTEVDSEALAHIIAPVFNSTASKEELEEEMGKVDGAYAIASYNQEENMVFLTRNGERPLTILETPDSFMFASETGMLLWIAGRNGYDISKCTLKVLKEHTIWALDLATNMVVEQDYTPKKAQPPVATTATGGKQKVSTNGATRNTRTLSETAVSKNGLKRLKGRFLGKRHTFYTDDWVEKNYPKTIEDGETEVWLMGEFDAEAFNSITHSVHAVVDLNTLFPTTVPEDFTSELYSGVIIDITMDRVRGEYRFVVQDVKTFAKADIQKTMDTVLATTQGKWNAKITPTVH